MTAVALAYGITAALTVAFGLGVLLSGRPLLAGYFLTATMIGLGALFWELQSPTLAGIQILVYGGGVLVMVLFVIMVTPSGTPSQHPSPAWRSTLILSPVAGYLAAQNYPAHTRPILGRNLGRWLLMRQGFSLEALAFFLLLALVAAVAIVLGRQKEETS